MAYSRAGWVLTLLMLMDGVGCAEGSAIQTGGGDASGGSPGVGGEGAGNETTTTATSAPQGGTGGDGAGGDALPAQACPPDQFVTGVDGAGALTCSTIEAATTAAVNAGCSVYFGWRDSCGSCSTAPEKWGFAKAASCMNGLGGNGTCQTPSLGGQTVQLFGLNTDGDVGDDDKFYVSLHCPAGDAQPAPGPCGTDEFVSGATGDSVTCVPASGVVLDYVRTSCSLYLGWRDSCDGCTTPPERWGRVGPTDCANGAGASNTCSTATLGGQSVQLLGVNSGGDVDDNDKLYLGLHCTAPVADSGMATGACPAGQLLTGIAADGSLACASPAPLVASYFGARCATYFGSRDNCDGCSSPPEKWGLARNGSCQNGVGANNTCAATALGSASVQLFGLNTDGDVNDDDKLYIGFGCF
jgi:hypothetical protein